jgi:hypothetical protein
LHRDERYPPDAFIHFKGHGMQATAADNAEAMVVVTLLSSVMTHHNRSDGDARIELASRIGVIRPSELEWLR